MHSNTLVENIYFTLNLVPSTPLWEEWKRGSFELLSLLECLIEEREIIANLGEISFYV